MTRLPGAIFGKYRKLFWSLQAVKAANGLVILTSKFLCRLDTLCHGEGCCSFLRCLGGRSGPTISRDFLAYLRRAARVRAIGSAWLSGKPTTPARYRSFANTNTGCV